jgi:SSS family solute:Na+ symporter
METFGTLNWTILVVYIVGNLLLGYYISKRISTADHFYLGNRQTPWWAIGISVVATYVSALSFLGGPSWAYTDGFSVIALHANYPLVIFVVITLFLPFFYNSGVASIYDYQERRFGPRARALISSIWLVSQTMTSAAILYATSLVLEFITGIDVLHAIIIVTIIALVYTALGGITAVIWTDVAQAGILLVGAIIILFALLQQMPESIGTTLTTLKAQGKLNPLEFDW